MPDFVIIGAQRCGTTALYYNLTRHSCVIPAVMKETHFFDNNNNFRKGINLYRGSFSTAINKWYRALLQGESIITGEATPDYIFYPYVPKRVLKMIPEAKIIAILRNPVDRAYSHYIHQVKWGRETLSFEEAINIEKQRIFGEYEKVLKDEKYHSYSLHHYSYLIRGVYVDQLKIWFDTFPNEQILILKSEEFLVNASKTYLKVLDFLGIPLWEIKQYSIVGKERYSPMNISTRKFLIDYFKPHNKRLYDFLETDFGWDK
jgi:hypothetical protein